MEFYELSDSENLVFAGIISSLKTLNKDSRYKVLRKVAHVMDRQIVRLGAVRTAAAASAAGVSARIGSKRNSQNPNPSKKDVSPIKHQWEQSDEAKSLISDRDTFKKSLEGKEPNAEQKAIISAKSVKIRHSMHAFLASRKNKEDDKYASEAGKASSAQENKESKTLSGTANAAPQQAPGNLPAAIGVTSRVTPNQVGGSAQSTQPQTSLRRT